MARSYLISGFGLAIANTIGLIAIDFNISVVTKFEIESPIKTSALIIASSKVFIFFLEANSIFCLLKPCRSERITPLLSSITIFSLFAPKDL